MAAVATSRRPAVPDGGLLDWVRHYGLVVVATTVLGVVLGIAWGALTTPRAEMWSIVVDTEQTLPSRQLGIVAETLFRAEGTYRPALTDLGLDWTPQDLFETVELRSVPESRLLIVVGTADDTYNAAIVSDAMARSLTAAFEQSGYPGFEILGAPQPPTVSSTVSLPVFAALGGSVALLLALALAVFHFRTRRPVLSVGTATAVVAADAVVSLPRRWGALGVVRRILPTGMSVAAKDVARRRLQADETTLWFSWPGQSSRRAARLAATLDLDVDPDAERRVVVADPGSRWADLDADWMTAASGHTTLLWLS